MRQGGLATFLYVATWSFRGSGNWASPLSTDVSNASSPASTCVRNDELRVAVDLYHDLPRSASSFARVPVRYMMHCALFEIPTVQAAPRQLSVDRF